VYFYTVATVQGQHFNTQHLEEMGCKFGEALAKLKARHMMRSLPLQGVGSAVSAPGHTAGADSPLPTASTFVDDDFPVYVLTDLLMRRGLRGVCSNITNKWSEYLPERLHRHRTWMVQLYSPGCASVHSNVIHVSLDTPKSITQTVSQSVQRLLHRSRS